MIFFIMGALIGTFLGIGLAIYFDQHKFAIKNKEKWSTFAHYFLIYSTFVVGIGIYWMNRDEFGKVHIQSPRDVFHVMFTNNIIKELLFFTAVLVLLLVIMLIIKAPFIKWEHVRLLGFEAKRAIKERAEQEAKEELDYMYILENLRLDVIELFTSELTYDIIDKHIDLESRQFNGKHALEEILESLCILYRESHLNCTIRFGVITIHKHQISVSDYEDYTKLPHYLREDIDYVMKYQVPHKWSYNNIYTFVTPISFFNDQEVYYIIHLSSYDFEFNTLTEREFEIIKSIIQNYIRLSDLANTSTDSEQPVVKYE